MDIIRHISVMDPTKLRHCSIVVAGIGVLGSPVALQLAKLGYTNITLFDPDVVEGHNLPNQMLYGTEDIGRHKVLAASDTIASLTSETYRPQVRAECLVGKHQMPNKPTYLFVATDSMDARKSIFRNCVLLNPDVVYYCEGRMNSRQGSIYAFNMGDRQKARVYEKYFLYDDADVVDDRGACGNVLSIGSTGMGLASNMVWHFIATHGSKPHLPYEELWVDFTTGQTIPRMLPDA